MCFTASIGYFPLAVSAESMRASVPSKMAFATSEASARVGTGWLTIDSSIWVAVMTGRPRRLASRMISFWSVGTVSGASSTPRSPLATITPSATPRMSIEIVDRLGPLDLGDDVQVLPAVLLEERAKLPDVLFLRTKDMRDEIDVELEPEDRVALVLLGEGRR